MQAARRQEAAAAMRLKQEAVVERKLHDAQAALLRLQNATPSAQRFVAQEMKFNDISAWKNGLPGLMSPPRRSIREELRTNCGGEYLRDFEYVLGTAEERVDSIDTGESKTARVRDRGRTGWTVETFMQLPAVRLAKLTQAEMILCRLYTGSLFKPLNAALRTGDGIDDWATCIAVLYEAVMKLSLSNEFKGTLYRGIDERRLTLPSSFLNSGSAGFAGGVEPAFMSSTQDEAIALEYSGGVRAKGSIFHINCDLASRGADVSSISLYPEERELVWPPCTALTVESNSSSDARRRQLIVRATVSAARYPVDHITSVDVVPHASAVRERGAECWWFNYGNLPMSTLEALFQSPAFKDVAKHTGQEHGVVKQHHAACVSGWLRCFGALSFTAGDPGGVRETASVVNLLPAISAIDEEFGDTTYGSAALLTRTQMGTLEAILTGSGMHHMVEVDIKLPEDQLPSSSGGERSKFRLVHGVTACLTETANIVYARPSDSHLDMVCGVIADAPWAQGDANGRYKGVRLPLRSAASGTTQETYVPVG